MPGAWPRRPLNSLTPVPLFQRGLDRVQFSHCSAVFVITGNLVMPFGDVLHKANSFPFLGFGQYQTRLSRPKRDFLQGPHQIADIVTVTSANLKSERCEFLVQRSQLAYILG